MPAAPKSCPDIGKRFPRRQQSAQATEKRLPKSKGGARSLCQLFLKDNAVHRRAAIGSRREKQGARLPWKRLPKEDHDSRARSALPEGRSRTGKCSRFLLRNAAQWSIAGVLPVRTRRCRRPANTSRVNTDRRYRASAARAGNTAAAVITVLLVDSVSAGKGAPPSAALDWERDHRTIARRALVLSSTRWPLR